MSVFNEQPNKPRLLPLVFIAVAVIGFGAFMIPFLVNGDPRWFLPGVSRQPDEFLIWQQGTSISIKKGDPDYDKINAVVEDSLTNIVNYSDFGPSEDTLKATRDGLSLEVLYDGPLTIHTQWNMGQPTRLLFPLSGYYLPERRFFLGQEDKYRSGGPQIKDVAPLIAVVNAVLSSRNALMATPTPDLSGLNDPTPTTEPTSAPATNTAEATAGAATPGTATTTGSTPTVPVASNDMDGGVSPEETLARLQGVTIPARDLYALNARLTLKVPAVPPTVVNANPRSYKEGDTETFWLGDIANNSYYTITAQLVTVSDHGYWWIADGYDADRDAIRDSADSFEQDIYPINRENFGAEPSPTIENDPHITVLYAPIPGVGGYFSSADLYPQLINPYSNQRKMIYIASDPSSGSALGTIAHEFQHMIHFAQHHQQDVWINEGMSEVAMRLNGYDPGGVGTIFLNDPDVQLNQWASTPDQSLAHYGAAYMFTDYFYQQFGGAKAIAALMQAKGTGIDSIENALKLLNRPESFNNVFTNWALANWLDREGLEERYQYPDTDVEAESTKQFNSLPARYSGTVYQQGADYIDISPRQSVSNIKVDFNGEALANVLSVEPHSGEAMWWSNRGDLSDTSITRDFDLRSASGKLTLNFWLWYDIEPDYDFGYVEVSSDGGKTWDTLPGRFTTEDNPVGTNFGHGFTGKSGGNTPSWIQESVDLSPYAGKNVQIRFEYITDDGYNSQGMAVDDIRIPEIGYSDDVEAGAGGWQATGFARIGASIPQQYSVAVISYPTGSPPRVELLTLDAENKGSFTVSSVGGPSERIVVMVAGLAPYTIQRTNYTLSVETAP